MATFTSAPREWSWSRRCHRSRAGTPKRKAKFLPDMSRHSPATPPQSCRGIPQPAHKAPTPVARSGLALHLEPVSAIVPPCKSGCGRQLSEIVDIVAWRPGDAIAPRACPAPAGRVNPRCHDHAAPGWESHMRTPFTGSAAAFAGVLLAGILFANEVRAQTACIPRQQRCDPRLLSGRRVRTAQRPFLRGQRHPANGGRHLTGRTVQAGRPVLAAPTGAWDPARTCSLSARTNVRLPIGIH